MLRQFNVHTSQALNAYCKLFCNAARLITWLNKLLCNGKSVPLQAWTSPEGSRKLRFPDFVTTAQDGGRLSVLRTGRIYPQEMLLVLISVRDWVDPRVIVRPEGFYVNEKSLTPARIEPAIFWFVAQHLNHCATAVPKVLCGLTKIKSPINKDIFFCQCIAKWDFQKLFYLAHSYVGLNLTFISPQILGYSNTDNRMDVSCVIQQRHRKWMHDLGGESCMKYINWNTLAYIRG